MLSLESYFLYKHDLLCDLCVFLTLRALRETKMEEWNLMLVCRVLVLAERAEALYACTPEVSGQILPRHARSKRTRGSSSGRRRSPVPSKEFLHFRFLRKGGNTKPKDQAAHDPVTPFWRDGPKTYSSLQSYLITVTLPFLLCTRQPTETSIK